MSLTPIYHSILGLSLALVGLAVVALVIDALSDLYHRSR